MSFLQVLRFGQGEFEYGRVKSDQFPNYIYRHIILSGYNFKHVFR